MDVINLTRQDIITFPFPYKLWIVVQLDFCTFLRWNPDGTILLLDLAGLEGYLNSARSIFKVKNHSAFLQHLEEFQFERLNATPEIGEDILMQYKHIHFQRHRLDLVAKIRRPFHQSQNHKFTHFHNSNGDLATYESGTMRILSPQVYSKSITGSNSRGQHMVGDLCFKFHGYISKIQASRMLLQTVLSFQTETRILQKKLRICDEKAVNKRRSKSETTNSTKINCSTSEADDEPIVDLSADLFENPYESTSNNDSRTEYAGYYGNCSTEQIINFFGDYLPQYEEGTPEAKKIVVESSAIYQDASLDDEQDQSYVQSFPHVPYETSYETVVASPENLTVQYDRTDTSYSPNLKQFFEAERDEQTNHEYIEEIPATQVKQNCPDIEDNLIMNEFLKFQNSNIHENQNINTDNNSNDGNVDKDNLTSNDIIENENEIIESFIAMETSTVDDTATVATATVTNPTINNVNSANAIIGMGETNEGIHFLPMSMDVRMDTNQSNVTTQENGAKLCSFFDEYRASLSLLNERY